MKKIIVAAALLLAFPVSAQAVTHTVQSGDTMWKIAVRYQVGCQEIIDANTQVTNPNLVYPGQKLNIPVQERAYEQEVLDLVNAERAKVGVSPLKLNWELSRVARFKSEDMLNNGYFSHTSPTYGSPFQMMKDFGIRYNYAAENIAKGQRTSDEVVKAWMNSSVHRANILNGKYTEMGIGKSGTYWTQMFKD